MAFWAAMAPALAQNAGSMEKYDKSPEASASAAAGIDLADNMLQQYYQREKARALSDAQDQAVEMERRKNLAQRQLAMRGALADWRRMGPATYNPEGR